ncbi:MAG: hypothetical protein H0X62_09765 [Bacteroidetes bacterium]|nr:hypothetical protein [Bacteroidota bacterium]
MKCLYAKKYISEKQATSIFLLEVFENKTAAKAELMIEFHIDQFGTS